MENVANDTVFLKPDNRDSEKPWFYWHFKAVVKQPRTVTFKFTQSNVLTTFGPGISTDGGESWMWLFKQPRDQNYFDYTFDHVEQPILFSMGMPYLESDMDEFGQQFANNPNFIKEVLCVSNKGREVEKITISPRTHEVKAKVLITARHHASEMMANYLMEGIIVAMMSADGGSWLRDHAEVMLVPFMDKDGVELGDQGKHRMPRDHNRDYVGESVYSSTGRLRELIPGWAGDLPLFALDLHCPWIKGDFNEVIYLVGSSNPRIAQEQAIFSEILEKQQEGMLRFKRSNYLPFGEAWNTEKNFDKGMSFSRWAGSLSGALFAATLEMPYANNEGQQVTPESARSFGKDVFTAMDTYLQAKVN